MRQKLKTFQNNFQLSQNNRLTYVYKTNEKRNIIEITNVSLEIKIGKKWTTIIRFDNAHGRLHRHIYFSPENNTDVVDYINVKQKGSQKELLCWAIDDLKKNYINYKKKYLKRCKSIDFKHKIDLF